MRNIILTLVFTAVLGTGLMSCAVLEDVFGEDTVFTTSDQLVEGEQGAIIPFDQLPDSVKAKIPEGTSLVLATKDQLVADAAYVPAGGELDGDDVGGMMDAGFGLLKTFVPSLAAWEGVVTLFSQRKRKHYAKAAKSLIPTDKNMDLGGMIGSIGAALGVAHSSQTTKEQFDKEESV